MSNVAKPGAAAGPLPGAGPRDAGERPAKGAEFETVLRDKSQDAHAGRATTESVPASSAEGRSTRSASSRPDDHTAERGRGEGGEWRGLPGDVAVPTGPRAEPGAVAAFDSLRAADAVARVERIAEQIVRAAELRLGPGGTAEVRLVLDLGGLGQLRVALDRDAEGKLAVRFDGAGPEAARLIEGHGSELVGRLEARGLALREVALTGADGVVVRLGSPAEPTPPAPSSRAAGDAGSARDEASQQHPEDERRRGRREPPPATDEE